LELNGLQLGLERIEKLQATGPEEAQVEGIKLAALNCQSILEEFLSKIKKYDASLGFVPPVASNLDSRNASSSHITQGNASVGRKGANVFKKASKKARVIQGEIEWEVKMTREFEAIRAYLLAHVGSLNMSLSALGL